jgi:hypothetical protein
VSGVPSRHEVNVWLGSKDSDTPVVCLSAKTSAGLPVEFRQELLGELSVGLRDKAVVDEESSRKKFGEVRYLKRVSPGEALRAVRKRVTWFFEKLSPTPNKSSARRQRKVRNQQNRRKERHNGRRYVRLFRNLAVQH